MAPANLSAMKKVRGVKFAFMHNGHNSHNGHWFNMCATETQPCDGHLPEPLERYRYRGDIVSNVW